MARKRRRSKKNKKNPLDYIAIPEIGISAEAKKGIFVLAILVLGALSLLGLFDLAGGFGNYLAKGQALAFGWGKWIFPFVLFIWGFLLYKEDRAYFRGAGIMGLMLSLVSVQALFHFVLPIEEWRSAIADGQGGGFVGLFLADVFLKILGFWGSLVFLFSLLLIALLLIFDTSLLKMIGGESIFAKIFSLPATLFKKIFSKKEKEEKSYVPEVQKADDEDEDEVMEEIIIKKGLFSKKKIKDEPEFMENNKEAVADKKINVEKKNKDQDDKKNWKSSKVKIDMPMDLLSNSSSKPTSGDIKNNSLIIQNTLKNFGINIEMREVNVGPTVTQYSFRPAEGVKLSKITTLSNDLSLALAAHPIRIEAPIPGKPLVGIEIPNKTKAMVGQREILESKAFKKRKTNLTIAIGKDVSGEAWTYDITKMPHLLVAGATNSGKSVCLNSIIVSLLYQNNPENLRFIMVDPKRVELTVYDGIPHLLTPVITNVNKTVNALKWCLNEMDRRFELLAVHKKRNIQSYNMIAKEKMPYLVFIVDELADLMVAASKDIEGSIIRLAQMARAVGIHLILATQRPSVDVITGLIKANMPARIAFSVASGVDSKTILDSLGAEKLLGQGDMLFLTAEISKPKRVQGAYISDDEIKNIVDHIKGKSGGFDYVDGVTDRQKVGGNAGVGLDGTTGDEDELFGEAKEIIINMNKASASFLQRKLSIGYARAARLLDELEEAGIIGPSNGAKAREIFVSKEQYEAEVSNPMAGTPVHNMAEAEAPENYLGDDDNSLGETGDNESIVLDDEDSSDNKDEVENDANKNDKIADEDNIKEEDKTEDKDDTKGDKTDDEGNDSDEKSRLDEDDEMFFAR